LGHIWIPKFLGYTVIILGLQDCKTVQDVGIWDSRMYLRIDSHIQPQMLISATEVFINDGYFSIVMA